MYPQPGQEPPDQSHGRPDPGQEPQSPPSEWHGRQVQPGYPPYAQGYPPMAPERPGQPGTVIGARVLMFVGGAFGLVMALLFGAVAAAPGALRGTGEGTTVQGVPVEELPLLFGVVAGVVGVYGLVSLVLAGLMGRRSPAVLWTVLVFQVLMLLLTFSNVVFGGLPAVLPMLYTIAIMVLLLVSRSREYFMAG